MAVFIAQVINFLWSLAMLLQPPCTSALSALSVSVKCLSGNHFIHTFLSSPRLFNLFPISPHHLSHSLSLPITSPTISPHHLSHSLSLPVTRSLPSPPPLPFSTSPPLPISPYLLPITFTSSSPSPCCSQL